MSELADHLNVIGIADTVVESFESFYLREYRPVLGVALALTRSRTEAEDLAQEAFVSAYRSWNRISNPSGWIRVAVTNKAVSRWRHLSVVERAIVKLRGVPDQTSDMPEDTIAFWAEVRALPRRQAQALILYYLEDRSTDEIADLLDCEASTVRIHLSRGRKALASRLEVSE